MESWVIATARPLLKKTFKIMGLTKYSTVYNTEEEGLEGMA